MTRINPFELSKSTAFGNVANIGAPEKIDQNDGQKDALSTQNIGDFQKADENTMVDTSSMADDMESFDMSGFDSESGAQTVGTTDGANKGEQGNNDNNKQDEEEIMANIEDMVKNYLDKKDTPES